MKYILITISLFFSLASFAQDNISLKVCDKPVVKEKNGNATFEKISLSIAEIENCFVLKTNNKNWKVTFFMISFKVGYTNQGINIKGNKINPRALELIQKNNPKKIFIEKIKITNAEGKTKYYGSFTINLK